MGHTQMQQPVVEVIPVCVERRLAFQGPQREYAKRIYQGVAEGRHGEYRQRPVCPHGGNLFRWSLHDAGRHHVDEHPQNEGTAVPQENPGRRNVEDDETGEGSSQGHTKGGVILLSRDLEPKRACDGNEQTIATGEGVDAINQIDGIDDYGVDEKRKWDGYDGRECSDTEQAAKVSDGKTSSHDEDAAYDELCDQLFDGVQLGEVILQTEEEKNDRCSSQAQKGNRFTILWLNQKGRGEQGADEYQNTTQSWNASLVNLAVLQRLVQQVLLHGKLNQRGHPEHYNDECKEKG